MTYQKPIRTSADTAFIARHGLYSEEQRRLADELKRRVEKEDVHLVRLVWVDSHGAARAKAVVPEVFVEALSKGYNINVATSTLDGSGGRVFASFTRGGGMGLEEMTGSPNLVIVPDPATFRGLPWAPGVGWVLCDEYFRDGKPFHFSTRRLLKTQVARLAKQGRDCRVGLEVEWYLAKAAEDGFTEEHVGVPGLRGRALRTTPVEPGYSYHSETNLDLMQPIVSELAKGYQALALPVRSIENEWGPGQLECTFQAEDPLKAADDLVLMRTATRQICRRLGFFASFMCHPALKGYFSSGWHLHQSLISVDTGRNLFMPDKDGEVLSPLALAYLGGLLTHAPATTIFATPTVNGYRRFRPNSLAPDRLVWGIDHRGVLFRVLGGAGDAATRIENRAGEPAANPYLFIAGQIIAGLDGIERNLDPGPPETDPYQSDHPALPTNLGEAIGTTDKDELIRRELGDIFIDYYVALKRAELGRFHTFCNGRGLEHIGGDVTEWEQNEYFDFF
jgi:glutamine synthetase